MAQLADLDPFSLRLAVKEDCGEHVLDCFVFDVGRNEYGREINSLERVADITGYHVNDAAELAPIKKLYVIGAWHLTPSQSECEGFGEPEPTRAEGEPHIFTREEKEWHDAGKMLSNFVALIPGLEELTWITSLPFTHHIWTGLTTTLSKLVIDIGNAVRLQVDGFDDVYKSYITANEMSPLTRQTKLKELRLFHMQNSHQLVIWETVYRNTSDGGMRLLELTMAESPFFRVEHWLDANKVTGLTVPIPQIGGREYKGIDGKGILHYSFGTGEYLDNLCMRRARIAAKIAESAPLPLSCLKLDGFIVDRLPFEEELTELELLTCEDGCVDAGLRAPTIRTAPHNGRSDSMGNAAPRCYIQWPNWSGAFSENGVELRDENGASVLPDWITMLPAPEYPSAEAAAAAAAAIAEWEKLAALYASESDSDSEDTEVASSDGYFYTTNLDTVIEEYEGEDEDTGYYGDTSETGTASETSDDESDNAFETGDEEQAGSSSDNASETGDEEHGNSSDNASQNGDEEHGNSSDNASNTGDEDHDDSSDNASQTGDEDHDDSSDNTSESGDEEHDNSADNASNTGDEEHDASSSSSSSSSSENAFHTGDEQHADASSSSSDNASESGDEERDDSSDKESLASVDTDDSEWIDE